MNGKYSKIHKSRSSTKKRLGGAEIREGKRRLDSLGEPNALSGMLFAEIADIGYIYADNVIRTKRLFVCSVYRKKRKYFCTSHFIRLADIEKILYGIYVK